MIVYRLEKNGIGPYQSQISNEKFIKIQDKLFNHHDSSSKFPSWANDDIFVDSSNWLSGFDSLQSLKKWFYGYITQLKKQGFQIVEYETDSIKIGKSKKQLAFLP